LALFPLALLLLTGLYLFVLPVCRQVVQRARRRRIGSERNGRGEAAATGSLAFGKLLASTSPFPASSQARTVHETDPNLRDRSHHRGKC
jgi:hypothetical protein